MSRKADYDLCFLNKDTDERGVIGAGWKNEDDESVSIVLNPFVVVSANRKVELRLFLRTPKLTPLADGTAAIALTEWQSTREGEPGPWEGEFSQ